MTQWTADDGELNQLFTTRKTMTSITQMSAFFYTNKVEQKMNIVFEAAQRSSWHLVYNVQSLGK